MDASNVAALLGKINQGTAGSTAHWALKKEKEEAKAQKKIRGKAIPTAPGAIIPISNPADAKESKTTLKNRLKGHGTGAAASQGAGTSASPSTHQPSTSQPQRSFKIPINKRFKDVCDYLRENVGDDYTFAEVHKATGHDLCIDEELLSRLRAHARVKIADDFDTSGHPLSSTRVRHKPQQEGVISKMRLLNFIRERKQNAKEGYALVSDVDDSYKGVLADIAQLKESKSIYTITDPDTVPPRTALFPVDMMGLVPIDEDLLSTFQETRPPKDVMELQGAVLSAGLKSALGAQQLKRPSKADLEAGKKRKKPKRERAFNVAKATNAHLPEFFNAPQPKKIEER